MSEDTVSFMPDGETADKARETYKALCEAAQRPYVGYRYRGDAALAVQVALAARRPLLLRGAPGSGKSTLAEDVAVCLDWPYYERVITSRTEARDLTYEVDAMRRLADAQAQAGPDGLKPIFNYVRPGALWWAFDPTSAARRGHEEHDGGLPPFALDPAVWQKRPRRRGAVVLLDEIDKAEPDVPNDLLVPLGAARFEVPEVNRLIAAARQLLIVITTNGERTLPAAFERRCIVLDLPRPTREGLAEVARAHVPNVEEALLQGVLDRFDALRVAADRQRERAPSTAELIDALRACVELKLTPDQPGWAAATRAALWKGGKRPPAEEEAQEA